jgi:hypothetical protein
MESISVQAFEKLIEKMLKKHGSLSSFLLCQFLHRERELDGIRNYNQAWRNLVAAGAVKLVSVRNFRGRWSKKKIWAWAELESDDRRQVCKGKIY